MMDYTAILRSQQNYFQSGETLPVAFRKEALLKLRSLLQQNESVLFRAIFSDFGKSSFETYTNELVVIYSEIAFYL